MPSNKRFLLGAVVLLFCLNAVSCKAKTQDSNENPQNTILGIFSAQGAEQVRSLPARDFLPWMEQVRGSFLLEDEGCLVAAVSGLGFYSFTSKTVAKPSVMSGRIFGEPFLLKSQSVYWTRTSESNESTAGYAFFTGLPGDSDFQILDAKGPEDGLPLDFISFGGEVLGHWKNGDKGHVYLYWQSRKTADQQVFLTAGKPGEMPAADPFSAEIKKMFPGQRIFIQSRDASACITDIQTIGDRIDSVPHIWTRRQTADGDKILTGTQLLGIDAKGKLKAFDLPLLKPGLVYTDFFLKDDVLTLLWEERQGHLTGLSGFLVIEPINFNIE